MPARKAPAAITTEMSDDGVTLILHYLPDGVKIPPEALADGSWLKLTTSTEVFIPNKWLLPLSSGFRGRLGYLADHGIFKPDP